MNILFLGYGQARTCLVEFLSLELNDVTEINRLVRIQEIAKSDLTISFGYRYILDKARLAAAKRPIINLHISMLPFNRGAHPIFWSYMDQTPIGVTIMEMDEGIDTGPILLQVETTLVKNQMTFREIHDSMLRQIENLFMRNWPAIRDRAIRTTKQSGEGTHHTAKQLPNFPGGWDANVLETINWYNN